jgi:osmotically-inducible protein OsmY
MFPAKEAAMGRSFVFVIGVVGIAAGTAVAQSTSRGSRVSSQNQFNSAAMNSGFGSSSGLGLNSFGSNSFGSNSFGNLGNTGIGQSSAAGRNTRQTGTTGQNQGRTNRSSASRSAANRGMMSNFGEMQNATPGGFANQQTQGRTGSVAVVRVGFAATLPAELSVNAQRMQQTLSAAAPSASRAIQVEHAAGVVTLRGQVGTEHEAKLAAAVASLEPGVRSVRNLLEVSQKSSP